MAWASSVADCLVVGRVVVAAGSAVVDVPAFVAVELTQGCRTSILLEYIHYTGDILT